MITQHVRFPLFLIVFFLLCAPLFGTEQGEPATKTLSPYFIIEKGDPSSELFPLKETNVSVSISGVIADVRVVQKYRNNGRQPIHGRYVFPASTRASVHGMKMTVGDQIVMAKIKERESAKVAFQKAKSEGKSASLLEQQRPNVFTMSISNIMPNDDIIIELHYTEIVVPTEGVYAFVYPTVVGPRYSNQSKRAAPETEKWVESPYLKNGKTPPAQFTMTAHLSTGIPLKEIASPSHKINIVRTDRSNATIRLDKSGEFAANRDFVLKYRLEGDRIESGLLLYKGERESFFLLTVQPPERVKPSEILPREYIFIVDVSGSMHGFPLDTAKVLIKNLIGSLKSTDMFNVMLFSGGSTVMAPSSIPATRENTVKAITLIESEKGGGGTKLSPALTRALSLPRQKGVARSVIIITDGYIDAERDIFNIITGNLNTTNFFSFGIGSSVNRYLIEGMAVAGLGEPFIVTKPDEAVPAAERFRKYVESPLLTNIKVKFQGFDVYDIEPQAIPDMFAQRPIMLLGKWRGTPSGNIIITGHTGSGAFSQTFPVADTKPLKENGALSYLWARTRVARLADHNFLGGNSDTKKEVTELGLTYSLLTPYTSFIAVLDKVRNTHKGTKNVDQPLPLPLGVSNLAVGGCQSVPEPEIAMLAALFLSIITIGILIRKRNRQSVTVHYRNTEPLSR